MSAAIRKGAERACQLARSGHFTNSFAVQAELSATDAQCMSEAFFRTEIDRLCNDARAGKESRR
jgi:hypothetical protein